MDDDRMPLGDQSAMMRKVSAERLTAGKSLGSMTGSRTTNFLSHARSILRTLGALGPSRSAGSWAVRDAAARTPPAASASQMAP